MPANHNCNLITVACSLSQVLIWLARWRLAWCICNFSAIASCGTAYTSTSRTSQANVWVWYQTDLTKIRGEIADAWKEKGRRWKIL